ncbi:MAG: sulfotransferase domain-containing protein [Phycisphaeraceae bacterium]|nr:sulfotransferase domain-containing protein [Phycisphaeraceae bacterium]
MGSQNGEARHTRAQLALRAASHRATWWIGRTFKRSVPLVFVVGYPKSGTTWMCQLLAECLQLPFPRFSLLPIGCPAVVHGHDTVGARDPRGVYSIRDGRDALVSFYFHMARHLPEGDRPRLSKAQRAIFPGLVNKNDVATNFPRFLERQMSHPTSCRVNWGRHVESYLSTRRPDWAMLRYEDLLSNGHAALAGAVSKVMGEPADDERVARALDTYSFARQSGRRAGQENKKSFLRKGQAGDWRNYFTREVAEIFDRSCGSALIGAGYEPDRAWVERCPASIEEIGAMAGSGATGGGA